MEISGTGPCWASIALASIAAAHGIAGGICWLPMSLSFRRSIRIAPGVHVNLGLHGAGLSVGPRGLLLWLNRRGMYTSAGIPGTRIYATQLAIQQIRNNT